MSMQQRKRGRVIVLATLFGLAVVLLLSLGTWQLARLQWKRDLIARVEARVHAQPQALPAPAAWNGIERARHEYLRVAARGYWLADRYAYVHASTALGTGYWLMAPLQLDDGNIVWVNRGYVAKAGSAAPAPSGPVQVTGLLRMSEPGGDLLRHNVPAENRWYSRDVNALTAVRGLSGVAPFFIDADSAPPAASQANGAAAEPVGGLTVVSFPNNHLVYALTWYALACMTAWAGFELLRTRRPGRRDHGGDDADDGDDSGAGQHGGSGRDDERGRRDRP
jgi:surfeit locus 1 family protein